MNVLKQGRESLDLELSVNFIRKEVVLSCGKRNWMICGHGALLALTRAAGPGFMRTLGGGGTRNLLEFCCRKTPHLLFFFLSCLFPSSSSLWPPGHLLGRPRAPGWPWTPQKGGAEAPPLKHQPSVCSRRLPSLVAPSFGYHYRPAGDGLEAPSSKNGGILHAPAPVRILWSSFLCPSYESSPEVYLAPLPPQVWLPGYLLCAKEWAQKPVVREVW